MNQMPDVCLPPSAPRFTPKQGQYLAFIHAYTLVLGRPPAEADLQRHFGVTPPSVHQMVLTLEHDLCFRASVHAQAGAIPSFYPCLYAGPRPPTSRSRPATPLRRYAAFGPPDGTHARARTLDPTQARRRPQHRSADRANRPPTPTTRPNCQLLCAEVLGGRDRPEPSPPALALGCVHIPKNAAVPATYSAVPAPAGTQGKRSAHCS